MPDTDETYEGWTNHETWAVALHINNDQGWQQSVHEALKGAREDSDPYSLALTDETRDALAAHRAGQIVKDNVEETLTERLSDYHRGVLDLDVYSIPREDIGSMWRVDWDEIGAAFLSDIEEA
jgi:hypothetical protein